MGCRARADARHRARHVSRRRERSPADCVGGCRQQGRVRRRHRGHRRRPPRRGRRSDSWASTCSSIAAYPCPTPTSVAIASTQHGPRRLHPRRLRRRAGRRRRGYLDFVGGGHDQRRHRERTSALSRLAAGPRGGAGGRPRRRRVSRLLRARRGKARPVHRLGDWHPPRLRTPGPRAATTATS